MIQIGRTYGRLTPIKLSHIGKNRHRHFQCRCECGTLKVCVGSALITKNTLSCGCLRRELRVKNNTTHGDRDSTEYDAWCYMKQRCLNRNNAHYRYYGGRGVTVCERWMHSYENFLADMGRKASPALSLDRIDPYGNYEPGNCRWATRLVQSQNQRRHIEKRNKNS